MKALYDRGLFVEALEGRTMMSAVACASATSPAPPAVAIVLPLSGSATDVSQQHTMRVDGTFTVTGVQGSRLSATVDANMYLDDGTPLHFTIDAHVKLMGN